MNTYIKRTPDGDLACSACSLFIAGNSWQSKHVRGYFCSASCRAACENNLDYCEQFLKSATDMPKIVKLGA